MINKDRKERNAARAEPSDRAIRKERFLDRWSRRKASVRVREEKEQFADRATDEAAGRLAPAGALKQIEEKTDADVPPIESLDANSDYTQFLSPKVSESLRRAALRKLFHLPQFNVMDGLDTYIADYRHYAPLGDIITADMRHQMERQAKAALARLEEKAGIVTSGEKPAVPDMTTEANATPVEQRPPEEPPTVGPGQDRIASESAATAADPANGKG